MKTNLKLADAYYRLSVEEANGGESSSITNQRSIVRQYCEDNGITIVKEFVETDYAKTSSGAPMGSRIFDLEEIFGKNKIPNDAHSLAERLLDFTWE